MMEQRICCIFGAGDYFGDETVPQHAFVIAADAGVKACKKLGVTPDVIIGDFDSLGYALEGENIITLPKIKDDTDTLAAVRYGLEKGFAKFLLFGCTGGRLSHTAANVQTLTFIAKHGAIGFLADKEEVATATCKGMYFDGECQGFLSVFAAEGSVNLSESGLKYEIAKQTVNADFPIGVSNEFIGTDAHITVHSGTALLIIQKQLDRTDWNRWFEKEYCEGCHFHK